MLDAKEIDIEIARLEYGESSYPAYAKLANLYTIRNQMRQQTEPAQPVPQYSQRAAVPEGEFETEFMRAVNGKDEAEVWKILDELMTALKTVSPRVYKSVMARISLL